MGESESEDFWLKFPGSAGRGHAFQISVVLSTTREQPHGREKETSKIYGSLDGRDSFRRNEGKSLVVTSPGDGV